MKRVIIAALACFPAIAFAASSGSSTPATPTQTTTTCERGQIWSDDTKSCVDPQESRLDDDTLYNAARELAYAGQYTNSLSVLAAMSDPNDDRVLTYKGFAHRKMGDVVLGNAYYRQAISQNPDNLLARSYMGQGFAEEGNIVQARAQLTEIRRRGGRGTWAEFSLRMAIDSGRGYNY